MGFNEDTIYRRHGRRFMTRDGPRVMPKERQEPRRHARDTYTKLGNI